MTDFFEINPRIPNQNKKIYFLTRKHNMEKNNFWNAIHILLKNYHAVNKKIFACKITTVQKILHGIKLLYKENNETCYQILEEIGKGGNDLKTCQSCENELTESLKFCNVNNCEGYIISMKLLTKNDGGYIAARGVLDFVNTQYICSFQSTKFDDFRVTIESEELLVSALTNHRQDVESNRWADYVLKPKLLKWSSLSEKKDNKLDSLHLIDIEAYNQLYKKLKAKYSQQLMDIWEECTDPLKYIYEDLAIAAYLICLWQQNHCEPIAFADLGCGNGLLVYILNCENYKGYGYDVRHRKIWSLYPKPTLLFEETIQPNQFQLPSEVDWIIGNHSDELSPWIPVLAAKIYKMKYFLLPCCPFEFSGMKYQRRNSELSAYNDFLNYVEIISSKCGFLTLKDRLKIPSTKRIALIGISRTYTELSHLQLSSSLQEFLSTEMQENSMKLREKQEAVRNCTQIESSIIDRIVKNIFLLLLDGSSQLSSWNEGRQRTIKEIAQNLSKEDLKSIKSECGGLKTLLKNKHEIFEFTPYDNVKIRRPGLRDPMNTKPYTTKKRACFFELNHPNGCPLSDSNCTFIHLNDNIPL